MMDITKSREAFETWAGGEFNDLSRGIYTGSNECVYLDSEVECCWKAWQASRESIEVELPERAKLERSGKNKGRYVCGPCSFDPEYALGINHTIDWFNEALRTVGIRVKGNEKS
ncbi:hypothetical protein [Yersinia rohdei]|uniref:hypothetical protein n=1 Tax=Yersinia rohdei TaxID=29485 RepID=UPI0011A29BCE|nr:hypothetical protein [Yersinia rohdei]